MSRRLDQKKRVSAPKKDNTSRGKLRPQSEKTPKNLRKLGTPATSSSSSSSRGRYFDTPNY
jgi:hypothetical protein